MLHQVPPCPRSPVASWVFYPNRSAVQAHTTPKPGRLLYSASGQGSPRRCLEPGLDGRCGRRNFSTCNNVCGCCRRRAWWIGDMRLSPSTGSCRRPRIAEAVQVLASCFTHDTAVLGLRLPERSSTLAGDGRSLCMDGVDQRRANHSKKSL